MYINGESTFEIQEQGKMKTVTVDRSVYKLSKQATEALKFKSIYDQWELDICEKNPYDNLIGGKSTVLMSKQQLSQHSNHKFHTSITKILQLTNNCLFYFLEEKIPKITINTIQLL